MRTCRAARCRWWPSAGRCSAAPGLLLLDEPSQGLAPKLIQDVMNTITRLTRENIGVLVVEQNVRSVLAVCDRVYVVRHGRVVHEGSAPALLADEATRTRLLGT